MTTHVTRTHALIGLEDLNTKGMLANHCLAQAVSDASFFEVKRQLLYKAEQYGASVQLVDRWYASSKTCSRCVTPVKGHHLSGEQSPTSSGNGSMPNVSLATEREDKDQSMTPREGE